MAALRVRMCVGNREGNLALKPHVNACHTHFEVCLWLSPQGLWPERMPLPLISLLCKQPLPSAVVQYLLLVQCSRA
jgi:hypothetical protein